MRDAFAGGSRDFGNAAAFGAADHPDQGVKEQPLAWGQSVPTFLATSLHTRLCSFSDRRGTRRLYQTLAATLAHPLGHLGAHPQRFFEKVIHRPIQLAVRHPRSAPPGDCTSESRELMG